MLQAGLTDVSTDDLKKLLRLLYRKEINCPLNPVELARTGLQNATNPLLGQLRGLEERAVWAVLTAVLSERLKR